MFVPRTPARRLTAAVLGSAVLTLGLAAAPAYAIDNTGSTKVEQPGSTTPQPDNNPQIEGCDVVVELRGYGSVAEGGEDITVFFQYAEGGPNGEAIPFTPTEPIRVTGSASGNELNGSGTYTLQPTGGDRLHVRVTPYAGSAALNTKVFWLNDCGPAASPSPSPSPSVEPSPTPSPTASPSVEPSPTVEPSPSVEPSPTPGKTHKPKPVKVNSGGEADASGLIFLGVAGAGLLGAAGFGIARSRRKN